MKLLICALTGLLVASPAFATAPSGEATGTCTPEEANRLAAQTADRINEILKNDPERAAAINQELNDMRLKRTADNLDHECEAYRTRMKEIEEARDRAGLPHEDNVNAPAGRQ